MFGARTNAQLVRELGMSQARVARAVDELVAVAAVRAVAPVTRVRARAWEPAALGEVLDRLRRRREPPPPVERWRRHMATLGGLGLPAVEHLGARRWPSRTLARRRVAQLTAGERHEHLTINTEEVFDPAATAAATPLDRSIIARGINVRVLGLPPSDGDRSTAYATGGMYRVIDRPPLKLMVFDRLVALLPADPLDLEMGYVEVDDPAAVRALGGLFDGLWSEARDPRRQGVPPIELSTRERALVRLLCQGHTDQSAADELGLSVRTVAYTMRGLMDRLGVENRFQLAVVLGATGTVPAPPPHGPGIAGTDDTATS
jgi:DNA-binding CsgD family transcriptional regulator